MSTPEKNKVVDAKWSNSDRVFRAKWNGNRWMQFDPLFSKWYSSTAPSEWKPVGGFNV